MAGAARAARRLVEAALAAVFPADCLLCGAPLPWRQRGSVCLPCWDRVPWAPGYRPAPFGAAGRARLDGVVWAADYEGEPRRLLHAFKFEGLDYLGPHLAAAAAARLRPLFAALPPCGLVVPVPLHPLRRLRRGFNQSLILARAFAAAAGPSATARPPVAQTLSRTRSGRRQVGLGRRERLESLAGYFRARPGGLLPLRGARVLLVDDVLTTGGTLAACAAALKEAGAAAVLGCVVARTARRRDPG